MEIWTKERWECGNISGEDIYNRLTDAGFPVVTVINRYPVFPPGAKVDWLAAQAAVLGEKVKAPKVDKVDEEPTKPKTTTSRVKAAVKKITKAKR